LNSDGIHMVAMVLFSFSGFLPLCATFFLGIRRRCAWGLRESLGAQGRCSNGGGGRTRNW
jgi:hypothetical protein